MDRQKFRTMMVALRNRATGNHEARQEGHKAPMLSRVTNHCDIDAIRKLDAILADKLTRVEAANKDLDDYILFRSEE